MSVPPDPAGADMMTEFYLEAARRLPITDIPVLSCFISNCGLAVGLAEPVTTILLTTINAFARKPSGPFFLFPDPNPDHALEKMRKKTTFAAGVRNSRSGLVMFMLCYFRHMTHAQAKKLLDMAGQDLTLAVLLVEEVPLRPDAARTKTALLQAGYRSWCSNTDDDSLVRLMTWRYPRELLDPVLDYLRGGKQLSADCIHKICDLLRCSWPLPPTPAPTPGTYRDSTTGNVTTIVKIRKDLFATTTISKDLVATTTITSTCSSRDDDFTNNPDNVHLSTVLATERRSRVNNNTWRENPDFLPLLKMSLLRTIHGFYIEALRILPSHALRESHLLNAVLTAGHCYGPMDPVSNIILNSIWYHVAFPVPNNVCNKIGAADILEARSMSRVEERSLDGLVAFVCYTHSISEQQAVMLLCEHRSNLSHLLQGSKKIFFNFASAAMVAKHPQPAAFEDFLNSLTPGKLDCLRSLISDKAPGYVLSDETLNQLKKMVTTETAGIAAATVQSVAPRLGQANLFIVSERRSTFKSQRDYVREKLEKLLLDYEHGKGLTYKLGIICGVTTARYGHHHTTCYHVNFLASSDVSNDATTSFRSWELFFAEFWSIADEKVEQSTNPPFCRPVRDFLDAYSIRCIVCDHTSCMIAHPS